MTVSREDLKRLCEEAKNTGTGAEAGTMLIGFALVAREALPALLAEVERLEARLEVDHVYTLVDGEMVREEVPPEKRGEYPDGIDCRDETIKLLEEDRERLKARLKQYEAVAPEPPNPLCGLNGGGIMLWGDSASIKKVRTALHELDAMMPARVAAITELKSRAEKAEAQVASLRAALEQKPTSYMLEIAARMVRDPNIARVAGFSREVVAASLASSAVDTALNPESSPND